MKKLPLYLITTRSSGNSGKNLNNMLFLCKMISSLFFWNKGKGEHGMVNQGIPNIFIFNRLLLWHDVGEKYEISQLPACFMTERTMDLFQIKYFLFPVSLARSPSGTLFYFWWFCDQTQHLSTMLVFCVVLEIDVLVS